MENSELGSNMTTLLLLPGLDGTGMIFAPLLAQFPAGIEAKVVNYPVDRVMSFQEHVAYASKHFPHKKPFVLLAESFSGPIGLQLLASPPDNLAGAILVATFAHYPRPFLLDASGYIPQSLILKMFSTALFCRYFCLGGAPSGTVNLFRKALLSVKLSVLSHRLKILSELPPAPDLKFTKPILYIQASNDRLVPTQAVLPLQKILPQLRVEQLPGPHIILLTQPEKGARLISNFIAMVTRSQ
jgi:pimeloyl-ACP methyl ester carboxylesterase